VGEFGEYWPKMNFEDERIVFGDEGGGMGERREGVFLNP
jgi:hypothetical protein